MVICGDTGFFFSLYGNDANSRRAVKWAAQCRQPVSLSAFNTYALGNALRFAEFRQAIRRGEAALYGAQFEAAMQQGRLVLEMCNLADVLDEGTAPPRTRRDGGRMIDLSHAGGADER